MKEKIRSIFNCIFEPLKKTLIVLLCIAIGALGYKYLDEYFERQRLINYPLEVIRHEAELTYYSYKNELTKVVKNYIDSIAPTSSLNGYAIVDYCEKYGLDIKFVLAQAQTESKFGTTGLAKKTNNIFNVGAFDKYTVEEINGRYKYKHPDYSIEPYMRLLYKDYIVNNKTELDLMAKYVNKDGKRYASNTNYERDILNLYKTINKRTDITRLQAEMARYKTICGK